MPHVFNELRGWPLHLGVKQSCGIGEGEGELVEDPVDEIPEHRPIQDLFQVLKPRVG